MKIYRCCICNRILRNEMKNRLSHYTFTKRPYSNQIKHEHYDFCLPCYLRIKDYIKYEKYLFEEV